jgi:predicted O-methyltransferase YrrM
MPLKHDEWVSRDHMGSEYEVGELLYGIIRLAKPELVVETGCYYGDTSAKIAQALCHNQKGWLVTCDIEEAKVNFTASMLVNFPVKTMVSKSLDMPQLKEADVVFSDSGCTPPDIPTRFREFELCKPGCLWVVHDATNYEEIGDFVKTHRGVILPYGRGVGIVNK